MNIEPNILFASHQGVPFVDDEVHVHNLPQGAPFHNALSPAIHGEPNFGLLVIRPGSADPTSRMRRSEPLARNEMQYSVDSRLG